MIGYIYKIINKENNRIYIGQTVDIERRKREHFNSLQSGFHHNKKLQEDWDKYKKEAFSFSFEIFEDITKAKLDELEKENIKTHSSNSNIYNLTIGGDGGNTRGKLTYEDYLFIFLGCQWQGYTEVIANHLKIDSSTVSAILREKSYLWYRDCAIKESDYIKEFYISSFREAFGIEKNKPFEERQIKHLSQEDYFYSLCVASCYGRGIEQALANYFGKHKSFLSNGCKNKKKGKAYNAIQSFNILSRSDIEKIGKEKFEEWNIQKYSKSSLKLLYNDKWRN